MPAATRRLIMLHSNKTHHQYLIGPGHNNEALMSLTISCMATWQQLGSSHGAFRIYPVSCCFSCLTSQGLIPRSKVFLERLSIAELEAGHTGRKSAHITLRQGIARCGCSFIDYTIMAGPQRRYISLISNIVVHLTSHIPSAFALSRTQTLSAAFPPRYMLSFTNPRLCQFMSANKDRSSHCL
jgi:hypothetical protein